MYRLHPTPVPRTGQLAHWRHERYNNAMNSAPETKPKRGWSAPHSAALAFVATAAALIAARPEGDTAWMVPALAVSTGMLAGIFHAKRLTALLGGAAAGLIIGLSSSISLLRYEVADKFVVVTSNIAVSLVLGLVFGAFIEFVMYLHRITHR
jgi:hypothetical protein